MMAVKQKSSKSLTNIDVKLFKDQALGMGTYGKVYRARYGSLLCAAKLIHETFVHPEGSKLVPMQKQHRLPYKRFEKECEVLQKLRHPNVIQYLSVYRDPDTNLPALLMELMDDNLTHFLKHANSHSLQQIPFHIQVNICHDIALALSFLHANNVIHRDLSSYNVLLFGDIRAKVSDFGMAMLHVEDGQTNQFTRTMCPGTDAYMPPEAVRDRPVYSEKIDCFSLGVLIVQILTQLFPAPGSRQEEMELNDSRLLKGRKVMVPIPESERRKDHIAKIDPRHPLLAIALDCLKDSESERPSAEEICEKVVVLKGSAQYVNSMEMTSKKGGVFSRRKTKRADGPFLHSLSKKEERIKNVEKEIFQLNNLKKEAIKAKEIEIEELKKHLADAMAEAREVGVDQQPEKELKPKLSGMPYDTHMFKRMHASS